MKNYSNNVKKIYDFTCTYNCSERPDTCWGVDAITGKNIEKYSELNRHHIIPREYGGGNEASNILIVNRYTHKLIHALSKQTIINFVRKAELKPKNLKVLNYYRKLAHRYPISAKFYFENCVADSNDILAA